MGLLCWGESEARTPTSVLCFIQGPDKALVNEGQERDTSITEMFIGSSTDMG